LLEESETDRKEKKFTLCKEKKLYRRELLVLGGKSTKGGQKMQDNNHTESGRNRAWRAKLRIEDE